LPWQRFEKRGRSVAWRAVLALAIGVPVALAPSSARAEDPAVEQLLSRGIELRQQSKDDEALATFERAHALAPSGRTRAQVALAEQALGLWVRAERDLEAALATSDPWVARQRPALEGALVVVRRHVGSLEVRGPDGAEVVLDGVALGVLPAARPFRVEAGRRALEVRAPGHHSAGRVVEVAPGGTARETVTLVAIDTRAAAPAAPVPPAVPGGEGKSTPPPTTAPTPEAVADPGRTQRLVGWSLLGGGGVLAVTGAVALLVRRAAVDEYNVHCPGLGADQSPDCQDRVESERTWLTVSIVSFVAAGALVISGVTVAATAPSRARVAGSPPRPSPLRCAPGLSPGGASFGCVGTF